MAQNVTARTDQSHRDALDAYVSDGEADSRSEALRETSTAELARMGYMNGTTKDTTLRKLFREFARVFSYGGFAWLGLTVMMDLALRLAGVWLLAVGLVLFGIDRGLARLEPRVSNGIKGIFIQGEKA